MIEGEDYVDLVVMIAFGILVGLGTHNFYIGWAATLFVWLQKPWHP